MAITEKITDALIGGRSRAFLSDGSEDVLFNVLLSIKRDRSNKVTSYAIEKGSDVSDHIIQDPTGYSLSILLTDEDLDLLNPETFVNKTIEERKALLDKWQDEKTVLTYFGHETDVESVVLEKVSDDKSAEAGSGLNLSITMRSINIADSATVDIDIRRPIPQAGLTPATSSTVTTGAGANKSMLRSLF